MTEEEKKAITYVKKDLEKAIKLELQIVNTDRFSIETILNLIQKKQKEIEKKDKINDEMAEEINKKYTVNEKSENIKLIKQYFENKLEGE